MTADDNCYDKNFNGIFINTLRLIPLPSLSSVGCSGAWLESVTPVTVLVLVTVTVLVRPGKTSATQAQLSWCLCLSWAITTLYKIRYTLRVATTGQKCKVLKYWENQSPHRHNFDPRIREKFGGQKAFSGKIRGYWNFFGKNSGEFRAFWGGKLEEFKTFSRGNLGI